MRYTHLLFDADGTLYDFKEAEVYAITKLFEELGVPNTASIVEVYSIINKALWKEFEDGCVTIEALKTERFRRFFSHLGMDKDPIATGVRYLDFLASSNHMFDWTVEILEQLHAEGYRISLITNGIARVQRGRLAATDTTRMFDSIIISEEIGIQKPDPRFFDFISAEDRKNCLIIGDSLSSDIAGGIAAGIDTLWYNDGTQKASSVQPMYELDSMDKLPEFLHTI
ncbi:MAG: YjjG family noncanonical pyrimidine nucleotidase [Sphaerochaetaceae bacterium]|nr:YjjG family noncanonical pyrimidine nucleotidase [Sphaerochaetaceae bacterium]